MTDTQDDLIRKLDQLLDIERKALVDGELNKLAEIVDQKEELIDALNKAQIDEIKELKPVNDKVQRNQALLEQAMDGIRAVSRKLAELREVRKAFDTYDHLGKRNRIEPDTKTSVEKRA